MLGYSALAKPRQYRDAKPENLIFNMTDEGFHFVKMKEFFQELPVALSEARDADPDVAASADAT